MPPENIQLFSKNALLSNILSPTYVLGTWDKPYCATLYIRILHITYVESIEQETAKILGGNILQILLSYHWEVP